MGRLNSSQFQKAYRIFVAEESLRVPSHLGFSLLEGRIFYLPRRKKVVVHVSGKRLATNKGPPFVLTENLDWPDGGDFGGMRNHLKARLQANMLKLRSKEIPERDNQIRRCAAGKDPAEFSETGCPGCICWYCTVCPE